MPGMQIEPHRRERFRQHVDKELRDTLERERAEQALQRLKDEGLLPESEPDAE